MKADLPRREPTILRHWEAITDRGATTTLYQAVLNAHRAAPHRERFVLHDGPPYANGHLHMGHALNKILKDLIVKYRAMQGYETPYVPGWDCHGLPIELELMKKLKVDKHQVSREEFRKNAAAFAKEFVDIQREEFKRMGVLGDWDHPYLTMHETYQQTIVETFHQLKANGYIARWKKPVHWCPSCETALADAEIEYEDHTSPSMYVAFRGQINCLRAEQGDQSQDQLSRWRDISCVIWTTTPWTLPANVAIGIHPDEVYVVFENSRDHRKFLVAKKRLEAFKNVCRFEGRTIDETSANDLLSHGNVKHPWLDRKAFLYPAEFITMDTGTGLVHLAPGHGMDDYTVWMARHTHWSKACGRQDYELQTTHGKDVLSPVDEQGRFTENFDELEVKGKKVFDANREIIMFLKHRELLLNSENDTITHTYPHCWRCHEPVIVRATEQWFLKIDHQGLRQRLLNAVQPDHVRWIPEVSQHRIAGMIDRRPDWCLSRQRLWGTPIPQEPPSSSPAPAGSEGPSDDIFDVWFESGVSWAAVLQQRPELAYPADLYLEGSDQHRGWFQTSLIPSVALEGKAPYQAVLTHGFVVDGEGRKMSKSLGNVMAPQEVIERYGADILRLWVASSDYREDVRLSEDILKGLVETYRKLRNTIRYLLANLYDFQYAQHYAAGHNALLSVDRWALHQLTQVVREVQSAFDDYAFHRAVAVLNAWCATDLSSFYFDVLKDRLYTYRADDPARRAAQRVLYDLLSNGLRMLAPILSFTAEEAWGEFRKGPAASSEMPPSVFLTPFPAPGERPWLSPAEADDWTRIFQLREAINQKLEEQRRRGIMKGSLEARLTLVTSDHQHKEFLERYEEDWPMLTITSPPVTLRLGAVRERTSPAMTVPLVDIQVERAPGQKCQLCWRYTGHVDTASGLCQRCRDQHVVGPERA